LTIRDGARFHNGQPVIATKVKWRWDKQFENKAWPCVHFFNGSGGLKIVAVEAPDPRTLVYRLDAPSALFLKQLATIQCGIVATHRAAFAAGRRFAHGGRGPA